MQLDKAIDDATLMIKVRQTVSDEREALATFLGLLAIVEDRRLYADAGYPSLFAFCTKDLGLKGSESYARIQAARVARRFPTLIDRIASGAMCLSSIKHIAPYLTEANATSVLDDLIGKTTLEVEKYARELEAEKLRLLAPAQTPAPAPVPAPTPLPAPTTITDPQPDDQRPLLTLGSVPIPPTAGLSPAEFERLAASQRPDRARYVAPERVEIRFVADDTLLKKLERVKGIAMRKGVDGKLEEIFDHLIETYLDKHDPDRWHKKKRRRVRKQRKGDSRYVPAHIKRDVYDRDEGQCTFSAPDGVRCQGKVALEYDHIVPFATGGSSKDATNIRLRCRAHNRLAAEVVFGREHVAAKIAEHQNH